jgi:hypothetical protein
MQVIAHNGIAEDFDGENPGEEFKAFSGPFFSMGVIFSCATILSAEMSSSDASIDSVKHLNFIVSEDFTSVDTRHGNGLQRSGASSSDKA